MLQLASCIVFQRPSDSQICFIKRKESNLWGLPGGKLEPHESHLVQFLNLTGIPKPVIDRGEVHDALYLFSHDEFTLSGFLLAAIREGKEEAGLVPSSVHKNLPFPQIVYAAKPIYAAATGKDFFTLTFYSSQFEEDSSILDEDLDSSWEEIDFLISPNIFVPQYNSEIYKILKGYQ